jgi:hypothetical protein
MFNRLFSKKEHAINHRNSSDRYIYSSTSKLTPDEVQDYWVKVAQKLVVGTMNSVDHTAERIFILLSFEEKASSMDIFFQMDGQLRMWNDLDDEDHKREISHNLISQAPNIVKQVNCLYDSVDMTRIAYSQIQFEFESKAWYLHDITQDSVEAQLDKDPAFLKWFDDVSKDIDGLPLDSKQKITWGPFKPV